ncbi:unnamed protein product, partial [marine sediment metagenome]
MGWLEDDKRRIAAFATEDWPEHSMVMSVKRAHDEIDVLRDHIAKNRPTHYYCEDPWYSCPKAFDGCANDDKPDKCDCRADEKNAVIDELLNPDAAPSEIRTQYHLVCTQCGKLHWSEEAFQELCEECRPKETVEGKSHHEPKQCQRPNKDEVCPT